MKTKVSKAGLKLNFDLAKGTQVINLKIQKVTRNELQNYLINRSFLHKKANSISEVLEYYTCIQVDPINIVARSHELALFNRVKNFNVNDLYKELYERRNFFEYWLQLFSIIPIKYYSYLKARFTTKKGWQQEYKNTHKKEIAAALRYIRKYGVSQAKDLTHIPKIGSLFSWSNSSSRTALLEFLWDTGKVMIHSRKNNQKFYDLTARLLPARVLAQKVSSRESLDFLLRAQFAYVGIVRRTFLTSGRMGYVKRLGLVEMFDRWVKNGKIVELEIDGIRTHYYCLAKQLAEIKRLGKVNLHKRLNILSPLDPLIIDRKLISDVFNFTYTWEAYIPKRKRKFGYYGMPILYKGEFVGQVELEKLKSNLSSTSYPTGMRLRRRGKLKIAKFQPKAGSPIARKVKRVDANEKGGDFKKMLDDEIRAMSNMLR